MRLVPNVFVAAGMMYAIGLAPSQGFAQTMEPLGDFPGGRFHSEALDVSADGLVVVGVGTGEKGREAFRWTKEGGMQGLGDLPGGRFDSSALAVSANGSVVVGMASGTDNGEDGWEAFRWTKEDGMVGLGGLVERGTHPHLSGSTGVSADGSVVVGFSHNGKGCEGP